MEGIVNDAVQAMMATAPCDGKKHSLARVTKRVDECVAAITGQGRECAVRALETVSRALSMVLRNPNEARFRRINVGGDAFRRAAGDAWAHCKALLEAVGFEAASGSEGGVLELADSFPLFLVREANGCVEVAVDSMTGRKDAWDEGEGGEGGGANVDQWVGRRGARLVLAGEGGGLPPVVEEEEGTYDLTPADLLRLLESNRREIEKCETLASKKVPGGGAEECVVRFRLEDGNCIQATFHPSEPVSRLFHFVREATGGGGLPEPRLLTPPPLRVLRGDDATTLRDAGVVRSGLVNVRWSDGVKRGREVAASLPSS